MQQHPENQYINLLKKIIMEGEEREGRNGVTYSIFGNSIEFNIQKNGFPLLTTKKMFFRGIVEELLWFLRGETDSKILEAKGVSIWKGNTSREFLDSVGLCDLPVGSIGEAYSWQWRHFGAEQTDENRANKETCNGVGFDQLAYIIKELRDNPHGRRAVLSAWNPARMHRMALPPCHFAYQFYCSKGGLLNCMMTMRSNDVCCGAPYNYASTALFVTILAWALHMKPGRVIINTGDTHIYESHLEGVQEQTSREPFPFPTLHIAKEAPGEDASVEDIIQAIESLVYEDIVLENYKSHGVIKYIMVA